MKEDNIKQDSKVSIIVAIYNIEKFVSICIESIVKQDYKNLEIILVDDCSSDMSGKICDEYAKRDNRIIVIHHVKNMRHSCVRNDGLDKATGEYIVFVDGDDWLEKDFVTYMLKVIRTTKTDMAINLVNFTTRDTKVLEERKIEVWSAEKATAALLYPKIPVGVWNKIYRRDFIEKNKLRFHTELFTAEGDRFISDAAQRASNVGVGYKKVYHYRLNNSQSATTKYDIRQSLGAIKALLDIRKDLILETPDVLCAYNHHLWWNHFWNIRQILALNLKEKYREKYKASVKYVRKNFIMAAKYEESLNRKVKHYLTGVFPISAAKFINYKFEKDLKKDLKNIENKR